MTAYHVTHGMSGAIMVLPRDGLTDGAGRPLRYDRAWYVGESDFYVPRDAEGRWKTYDGAGHDYVDAVQEMTTLRPTHIVFNGAVGALTGESAVRAQVGERVLFVHSQASRDTRPRIVGAQADYVWETGSVADPPATGLETGLVRGGSAGAALHEFVQPGRYEYVNHNLIEALHLGAAGEIHVDGAWNGDLMSVVHGPRKLQSG